MSKACFKRLHWNPLKLDVDVTNHASQCSVSDLICQLLPIPILQQSHTFPWTLSQILKKKKMLFDLEQHQELLGECCDILQRIRQSTDAVASQQSGFDCLLEATWNNCVRPTSGHLIRWCHVFCFCRLEVYSLRQFSWSPFHMDANVIFLCTCGLTTGEVLTVGLPPSSNTLLGTGLEDCVDALVGQAWGG